MTEPLPHNGTEPHPARGENARPWQAAALVATLAASLVIALAWEPAHLRGVRMLPHAAAGRFALPEVAEPSGVTFHPTRGTLFVLGDEGAVAELSPQGGVLRRAELGIRNLEAVTVDPATGLLYAGVEEKEQILEIDPASLQVRRRFTIEREFEGRVVLAAGGALTGIEGLAFRSDPAHPEGGTFLVLNQAFPGGQEDDASAILELEAPLRSVDDERRASARILRRWPMETPDLSAAHWDATRSRLWVVSDLHNLVMVFDPDRGEIKRRWRLPGVEQEGFTIDSTGHAWIAQDSGGLLRLRLEMRHIDAPERDE